MILSIHWPSLCRRHDQRVGKRRKASDVAQVLLTNTTWTSRHAIWRASSLSMIATSSSSSTKISTMRASTQSCTFPTRSQRPSVTKQRLPQEPCSLSNQRWTHWLATYKKQLKTRTWSWMACADASIRTHVTHKTYSQEFYNYLKGITSHLRHLMAFGSNASAN